MDKKELKNYLAKQKLGSATGKELKALEQYADDLVKKSDVHVFQSDIEKHQIKKELQSRISISASSKSFWWRNIAASVALLIGLSVSFWMTKDFFFGAKNYLW